MSELPPGWAWTTLDELVFTRSGNSKLIKGKLPKSHRPGLFPAFSASGQDVWCPDAEYEGEGIVLSAVGARCGKAFLATGAWTAIANTHVILAASGIETRFLWYLLNDEAFWIRSGSAQSFVKVKASLETKLGLPPLHEQRRIVAAIEEQLSRLDAADASLAQGRARVDALKRETVARALAGNWGVVTMSNVTESQAYGTSAKASSDASGVPVLRMGNINGGRIDFTDLKYLAADHPDVAKLALRPGDLLFNRTNSPELVGKSAVFMGAEPMTFASYLIRVRFTERCDPQWAALVINSVIGRRYIATVRTQQVGQANVNGTKLAAMPLPLPPLQEQQRIVSEVEERLSVIDAMRASIERAERRSAALRRSILERAFRGELVPQDPSDEPASVLVERIRAARSSARPTHRSRV
ncbi:restriction endonuclease subunit S [soil metagenome]